MTNAEAHLASYFAKYEPATAKLGMALRAKLRARLPGLFEIVYVYESQSALVANQGEERESGEGKPRPFDGASAECCKRHRSYWMQPV